MDVATLDADRVDKLTAVSTADALPGDFSLNADESHIGIVVGRTENGKLLVCHWLLHISDTQLSYITNADAGSGLTKVAGSIVPFRSEFPRDTELFYYAGGKVK